VRHQRRQGRLALWRGHHRRSRRIAPAEPDRTGPRPLPGRACGENHRQASGLSAMGKLIDGVWHDVWYDTQSTGGKFQREEANFRNRIGDAGFEAEPGRYHLYVSYACPWAHRTLIFRAIKGLEDMISV